MGGGTQSGALSSVQAGRQAGGSGGRPGALGRLKGQKTGREAASQTAREEAVVDWGINGLTARLLKDRGSCWSWSAMSDAKATTVGAACSELHAQLRDAAVALQLPGAADSGRSASGAINPWFTFDKEEP